MSASQPPPGDHLILGGCGFIGRAVAAELARAGHKIRLADRALPPETLASDLAQHGAYVPFTLEDADWDRLIEGAAVIYHLAWTSIPASANADPGRDLSDNVLPTIALLDALRRKGEEAPRLVFASSGGTVYGKLRHIPVTEDHPLQPITGYGTGKAAAELYISQYRTMHGLDCRIARISNPFGAGQNVARGQGAATTFLHHALNNLPIEIWGDGEVVRDYIHISDAVAGLIALASAPLEAAHWTFNIGSGHGISLNGIVRELETVLKRQLVVHRRPGRSFDVPVSILDIALARSVLHWQPRLSFARGLAQTVEELGSAAADS